MIRAAIVGASGYTGVELIRLLMPHPEVEISCLTAHQQAGRSISELFPSLKDRVLMTCGPVDIDEVSSKADVVFTALPHNAAMDIVPAFIANGKKVIDLSADYRLKDADIYAKWYDTHTSPDLLETAVYGLPEVFRKEIVTSPLIANPGCYPTSIALGLAPLLKEKIIAPETLVIDSKSGTSGAGRAAKVDTLFCEVNEGFKAYGVASHRHTPEIEQTLSDLYGQPVVVTFTPHLLPISRGILSTSYATLSCPKNTEELTRLYADYYRDEPFVRICAGSSLPNVAYVRGSNFCDVGVVCDSRTGRVVVVSAIDNLVKGAAGQAIQNMNIIFGLPETMGLESLPLFP